MLAGIISACSNFEKDNTKNDKTSWEGKHTGFYAESIRLVIIISGTYTNQSQSWKIIICRSSLPEVFLRKGILKLCTEFTGEHSCRKAISIKLLYNFIEIALRHGRFRLNLLHIFRTTFPSNTPEGLVLDVCKISDRQSFGIKMG